MWVKLLANRAMDEKTGHRVPAVLFSSDKPAGRPLGKGYSCFRPDATWRENNLCGRSKLFRKVQAIASSETNATIEGQPGNKD
jgi:hypothetical protein